MAKINLNMYVNQLPSNIIEKIMDRIELSLMYDYNVEEIKKAKADAYNSRLYDLEEAFHISELINE